MSSFNFNTISNANISLGNGEKLNVKKLSVKINGEVVAKDKEVSAEIKDGILIITTK